MITMGSSTQKSATMSVQFALELTMMTSLMDSCSESGFIVQTHVTVGGGCAVIELTEPLMVCMCVKFAVPALSSLYRLCMLCYFAVYATSIRLSHKWSKRISCYGYLLCQFAVMVENSFNEICMTG